MGIEEVGENVHILLAYLSEHPSDGLMYEIVRVIKQLRCQAQCIVKLSGAY